MTTRNGGPLPVRRTGPAGRWRGLFSAALLLAIAGCAHHPDPTAGNAVKVNTPQAAEQCDAQPNLAWCKP